MRVLATGASGFLGRAVVRALQDAGHEVRTLQRRPSGVEGAEDRLGSVTDPDAVASALDGIDGVVHLAAKVSLAGDPAQFRAGEANATVLEPAVGPSSVLTLDGAEHIRQRKVLLPPFHGERVKRYGETMRDAIERQIERFAPGFRDRILARHAMSPADFERYNPNYRGGAITGGVADAFQLFTRPVARLDPYSTPNPRLFLCSAATPPGGGVHGMSGYLAARVALRYLA